MFCFATIGSCFFFAEIQEELLRSVGGREIGFVILDFMDVVIARGWATDHAVEPQLLEGWRGDVTTRRRERSRLQRKTSLVTSALEGIFELENMENRFMTFLHCCCNLLHFCWTFTLRFFRALVVLGFVQNFHGNWCFPSLENRGLQRFLFILSLASASRLNLVSVSTLAFAGQNYTKWIQSATAGQSHDVQVVIPGIEARSQILSKHVWVPIRPRKAQEGTWTFVVLFSFFSESDIDVAHIRVFCWKSRGILHGSTMQSISFWHYLPRPLRLELLEYVQHSLRIANNPPNLWYFVIQNPAGLISSALQSEARDPEY